MGPGGQEQFAPETLASAVYMDEARTQTLPEKLAELEGSVVGPPGPVGPAGPVGPVGPAGPPGADGADGHTPTLAEIGAAAASHTHTPADIGAAAASHTHTPAAIGAAPASHTHTKANITDFGHTHTAADVGAIPSGNVGHHYTNPSNAHSAAADGLRTGFYGPGGLSSGQPSSYGNILSVGNGSEKSQLWFTQAGGSLYHRQGNGSGWNGNGTVDGWVEMLDKSNFLNLVYPVGSIYMSTSATNPGSLFGGSWERYAVGRVLVGVSEGEGEWYYAGQAGGSKYHTLTANEMPVHSHGQDAHSHGGGTGGQSQSHAHALGSRVLDNGGMNVVDKQITSAGYFGTNTDAVSGWADRDHWHGISAAQPGIWNNGAGWGHNNMQPYIAVYIWRRIG